MAESIALEIQAYAKTKPKHTAIIVGSERCTYEKLARYNRKVAFYLTNRGIQPGDRIVVEADHTVEYVCFWYGIQLLNAVFVPIEKNSPSRRILEIARELETDKIVCLQRRTDLPEAWALDELLEEVENVPDQFEATPPDTESLAEILFTTGTTGRSKGVMVSYGNQVNVALAGIETTNIQSDNIWLIPTPMNHAAALRKIHIAMAVGSTVCLLDGFRNVKLYLNTIRAENVTSLYLPPSAIHMLLALAPDSLAELDGQLRFIYSSSAAYPEADKEKMRALLPNVYMYNAFGCSEVGVVCTDEFCVSGGSAFSGSVGRPNSYSEIVLLDEAGNELNNATADHPGFAAIRSKSVMKGYWNDPEQTAKAIQNGCLVMSDLCYFAPNGELILVGRSNDTINIGGFKIAPTEVEEVATRADCVDECLLIPVTVRETTALKLLVVLKEGKTLDENSIRAEIAACLEPFKQPKQIEVINQIARTFNGKIDRKKMITEYSQ